MGGSQHGELPAELVRARARFQSWRRTRQPKSRIPEALWALAVKLTSAHGLHRTARALKLDYYSLKKRVEASQARKAAKRPAFIELPAAVMAGRECVIELEDAAGVSLRVHLKGYDAADVVTVGRGFRNAQ
jgi:hypothetical protein